MRLFIYIFTLIIIATGCKDKKLSQESLTEVSVIRDATDPNTSKEASSVKEKNDDREETENYTRPNYRQEKAQFHIIVASFTYAEKNKADKLTQSLKAEGYPAIIMDMKKRYRISIESFDNRQQAMKARDKYREITDRQDIWILEIK